MTRRRLRGLTEADRALWRAYAAEVAPLPGPRTAARAAGATRACRRRTRATAGSNGARAAAGRRPTSP